MINTELCEITDAEMRLGSTGLEVPVLAGATLTRRELRIHESRCCEVGAQQCRRYGRHEGLALRACRRSTRPNASVAEIAM